MLTIATSIMAGSTLLSKNIMFGGINVESNKGWWWNHWCDSVLKVASTEKEYEMIPNESTNVLVINLFPLRVKSWDSCDKIICQYVWTLISSCYLFPDILWLVFCMDSMFHGNNVDLHLNFKPHKWCETYKHLNIFFIFLNM